MSLLFPPLYIGITLADLRASGKVPLVIDRLIKRDKIEAICKDIF